MIEELFPFASERGLVKTIRTRLKVREEKNAAEYDLDPTWQRYTALSDEHLKAAFDAEIRRRDVIHRRGLATLGTLGFMSAFTVLVIGVGSRTQLPPWLPTSMAIATLMYFAGGAWAALRIVAPRPVFDLYLQSRMPGQTPLPATEWRNVMVSTLQLVQAQSLIDSCYASRAHRCLRNGVVMFTLTLLCLLAGTLF